MKNFSLLVFLLFISGPVFAVGPKNICDNKKIEYDFKSLYKFYVKMPSDGLQRWVFELPKSIAGGLSFIGVSLIYSTTQANEKSGHVRERTIEVMNIPVQAHEANGIFVGYFYLRNSKDSNVRIVADYTADPAGMISIDGDICQFQLAPRA